MEKLPVSANIRRYTTQEVIQNPVKGFVYACIWWNIAASLRSKIKSINEKAVSARDTLATSIT